MELRQRSGRVHRVRSRPRNWPNRRRSVRGGRSAAAGGRGCVRREIRRSLRRSGPGEGGRRARGSANEFGGGHVADQCPHDAGRKTGAGGKKEGIGSPAAPVAKDFGFEFRTIEFRAMKADIVTIFPDFFRGPLDHGITRRAAEMGLVKIEVHDLRQFTHDRHRTVDDRPFGGGEGMVLKPEPLFECLELLQLAPHAQRIAGDARETVILLSAQGQRFTQKVAAELAALDRIVLICGRYEGVDERVADFLADRELSIGDYVLSGGELAAAVIVEAVTRLLPGAVGNEASTRQESFTAHVPTGEVSAADSTCSSGGLLDYPHYTRPADFRGMPVPEVLLNGDHQQIRRWRREQALKKTVRNRPDLLAGAELSAEDAKMLASVKRDRK